MSGRLLKIFLRPSTRTPVREVSEVEAVAGRGLQGDHAKGGKRQVTLIERAAWERACADLGHEVDPAARRANLLVEGVELAQTRGRRLRVGEVVLEVCGETKPCQLMDDARLGLHDALRPEWRGGVFAQIVSGGALQKGDAVELLPAE